MGNGLIFLLLYVFAFASGVIFIRVMRDRRRITAEQESLPAGIKFVRFFVITLLSLVTGWGTISGRFSADFSATVFYGGIALTTFLTTYPGGRV